MEVDQKKAWYHMDRVRTAFLRLAGKPAEGRGYRLKPGIPGSIDRNGIPWPELDYPYCF